MTTKELPASVSWPKHWQNVPLWAMFDRVKDVGHPDEEMLSVYRRHGVIKKSSRDDNTNQTAENRNIYQLVDDGWLIVNRMKAWRGSVGISPFRGIVSGHYLCFRPTHNADPRFLDWMLRSDVYTTEYARMSRGVRPGQIEIDNDELRGLRVALPPAEEQRSIADFLADETRRAFSLMELRRIQSANLSELQLTRIGEQLGGAGVARQQPTGWPWLTSVPANWSIGPIYAYFNIELGKMLNVSRASGSHQQPYLRNANVHWHEIDTADMASMTFEPHERQRYRLNVGDLLVCEGGAGVAEAALWDGRFSPCYYQKSLHRVRAARDVPVGWLMYWLRFAKEAGVFNADGNLSTIPHLTGEQLAEYRIPIPPDAPQRVIEIDSQIAATRRAQAEMATADVLLAERVQALITAAVTGQIDVTTARGIET